MKNSTEVIVTIKSLVTLVIVGLGFLLGSKVLDFQESDSKLTYREHYLEISTSIMFILFVAAIFTLGLVYWNVCDQYKEKAVSNLVNDNGFFIKHTFLIYIIFYTFGVVSTYGISETLLL